MVGLLWGSTNEDKKLEEELMVKESSREWQRY